MAQKLGSETLETVNGGVKFGNIYQYYIYFTNRAGQPDGIKSEPIFNDEATCEAAMNEKVAQYEANGYNITGKEVKKVF